ncbi:MAG: DUF488 family protein [Solirubrobacterales bacterium]
MKLYTIGFTKKNAETFFELLGKNKVRFLLDIRLNNVSQLAGFAKGKDLEYFTSVILNIPYKHDIRLAPSKELYDKYKAGGITPEEFESEFKKVLKSRDFDSIILEEYGEFLENACLLCSEDKADGCHRKLIAEFIAELIPGTEISHL